MPHSFFFGACAARHLLLLLLLLMMMMMIRMRAAPKPRVRAFALTANRHGCWRAVSPIDGP